jgi:hypothetical protein
LLAIVWCLTIGTKTQHPNHKSHPKISNTPRKLNLKVSSTGRSSSLLSAAHTLYFQQFLTNTYRMIVRLLLRICGTHQEHHEENEQAIQSQTFPHANHIHSEQG